LHCDGYVLMRSYGNDCEIIRAPTLREITEHLKH
jgi:hypothetical protein